MNQASPDKPSQDLIELIEEFCEVTSQIQCEISVSLLNQESVKKDFDKHSTMSGNQVLERLNKAVCAFVGAMPLASANNINLFVSALSLHSAITGDPTMAEIIRKFREKHLGELPTMEDLADHE